MLQIQSVSKRFGSKLLFENADAQIGPRSRVALVGPNGSGKTTLLKMMLGLEEPDEGRITRSPRFTIGHLAQELPRFGSRSVLEETLHRDHIPEDAELHEEIWREEGRREALAKEILSGVGFPQEHFTKPIGELSGGWLMRVALSRVLLAQPDLLCLDEPTNHLDLESLFWLEDFLKNYRGALLLISHDTAFLNRLVTEVLEIDQRKLTSYRGNLESYAAQKQERMAVLRAQYEGQQSRIAEIERFVERFGAKATKARQAQSRLKELDRMERIELPEDRQSVRFRFPPAPHSGKEVVTARKAGKSYDGKIVFQNLDWVIRRGSRVAIVGPNGVGKTTLLKLLAGTLEATTGEVKLGHQVQVGYYAQHQADALDMRKTITEELELTAPDMPIAQVRGVAGAFLFSGDAVQKKCGVLSGGEKARVALAKLLLSPSNFLLLDEPTNHLDVESRGVLLDALADYEGTLCLVSHDRAFVEPLVDSVLEIDPETKTAIQLVGSYEDYLARLEARLRDQRARRSGKEAAPEAKETPAPTRTGPSNNQRQAWTRERDKLEGEIAALERRQAELQAALADPGTYEAKQEEGKPPRAIVLGDELRELAASLNKKLGRWEELSGWLG